MPKTILIVEDEAPIREALQNLFEKEGYSLLTASEGDAAVRIALEKHPDLILLDLIMPKLHGLEILRQLRNDTWGKDVAVFVLSNMDDKSMQRKAAELGVLDYYVKTNISLDEVINNVKNHFAQDRVK
ncbi:MAG: response regulator [Patescibacteria group bacterium]|jgi:two-component system sensor histidine kinase/response regulator